MERQAQHIVSDTLFTPEQLRELAYPDGRILCVVGKGWNGL
jgi:hypothetical protein